MNLESELKFRLSSAADFLEAIWKNGTFGHSFEQQKNPSKKVHLTHNLQTVSLLISLSDFLGRKRLAEIAAEAFDGLHVFSADSKKFIVHEEKSFVIWNALALIIELKRDNIQHAEAFANSLIECVGDNSMSPVYPPDFEEPPGWYAECILSLLLLYAKTSNEDHANFAAYIANLLLEQGIIPNHYEVWAFTLLYNVEQEQKYLNRAKKQITTFKQPAIKAMTSLFAACAQQALFASYPNTEWVGKDQKSRNKLHLDVLKQQVSLQVDKDKSFGWTPAFYGAFVLRTTRPTVRLDYVTQNCFAMMHYLSYLTGKKTPAII